MIVREHNELITRIGADRSAGMLLRKYWQQAALIDEFEDAEPVKTMTLIDQDLMLFRDEASRFRLLNRHGVLDCERTTVRTELKV